MAGGATEWADSIKSEFPAILKKNMGLTMQALNKAGLPKSTYYDWRKADPEFAQACDDAKEHMLDFAEAKLLNLVTKENLGAIVFYLKNAGRHRGWADEKNVTVVQPNVTQNDQKIFDDYISREVERRLLEQSAKLVEPNEPKDVTDSNDA